MEISEIASRYDRWFRTDLGRHADRVEKELMERMLFPRFKNGFNGTTVLDLGCGTGQYSIWLCKKGAGVTALDISDDMLSIARKKAEKEGCDIEFVKGNMEELKDIFPDRRFDMAMAVTSLEFLKEPERSVDGMRSVVKDGGIVAIAVLNSWSVWALVRTIKRWRRDTVFRGVRFYSPPSLLKLLGGHAEWSSALFAPPGAPPRLIALYERCERFNQRVFRPFGAFLLAVQTVAGGNNLGAEEKAERINGRTNGDMQVI